MSRNYKISGKVKKTREMKRRKPSTHEIRTRRQIRGEQAERKESGGGGIKLSLFADKKKAKIM